MTTLSALPSVLGVRAGSQLLFLSTEEKGPRNPGSPLPVGGTALYFFPSSSFDFICSMELFTFSSESVSLPYLFLNLWALVQTLADLYLNVSTTLGGSHYSRAGGFALSISFPNFFCPHLRQHSVTSAMLIIGLE